MGSAECKNNPADVSTRMIRRIKDQGKEVHPEERAAAKAEAKIEDQAVAKAAAKIEHNRH